MQDSGVFHHHPHHHRPLLQSQPPPTTTTTTQPPTGAAGKQTTSTMVQVTDEPLLCDDILSCILALDEVIAEFDDTHSLTTTTTTTNGNGSTTEGPGGTAGSSATTESLITSSPPSASDKPLVSTPRTKSRHSSSVTAITNTAVSQETSCTSQAEQEYKKNKTKENHYPFSSLAAQPQQLFCSTNCGAVVNSEEKLTAPKPFKPSHHQTAHKLQIMSFADTSSEPTLPSRESEVNTKQRVSLDQMERDLLALGMKQKKNNNGRSTKIPTLKSPTSPITIENSAVVNGGGSSNSSHGSGGSFPKVKLRSSSQNNPLLEYRSVKMQHFIFPDAAAVGSTDPEVIEEENWNFPTGKNLPRSLARTRDTSGAAQEDNALAKASNPRFKESKSSDVKVSRIPKLKLETTCPVYEDSSSFLPTSPQLQFSQSPPVKSPASHSRDSPTGSCGGRSSSSNSNNIINNNNSNIPVAKPRRNSANNNQSNNSNNNNNNNNNNSVTTRSDSFRAISFTASTPKQQQQQNELPLQNSPDLSYNNVQNFTKREICNNSNNLQQHSSVYNNQMLPNTTTTTASTPGETYRDNRQHFSEADDGYLSMINKRDDTATVLWPEEMIENEVFSEDELKRLSYQSASAGSGGGDCGSGGCLDDNHEIFAVNNSYNEVGADKTDYFSDDSLESESIEPEYPSLVTSGMENVKKTPTSISFFANVDYIRPAAVPKSRSNNKSDSGVPRPCSFFVSIDDDDSQPDTPSATNTPTVATTETAVYSKGSKKRGKRSPPIPNIRSAPAGSNATNNSPACVASPVARAPEQQQSLSSPPVEFTLTEAAAPTPRTTPESEPAEQCDTDRIIVGTTSEAEEPVTFIIHNNKIQNFAQALAYEIGRSGSEEAAVALNQQKQQVVDQGENCASNHQVTILSTSENLSTPILATEMSEQVSEGRKTPPESMTPTRTTVAEFLASNVPADEGGIQLTRNEERLSLLSSPPPEKLLPPNTANTIVLDIENEPTTDSETASKSSKLDSELEQVDRIIANLSKENPDDDVDVLPGKDESHQPIPQRPQSLDISALGRRWQQDSSSRKSGEEDNTSDDLSETPPAFIPEPPPTLVAAELNSSTLQQGLEGEKKKNVDESKKKDDEDRKDVVEEETKQQQAAAKTPPTFNTEPAESVTVAAAKSVSHSRGSSDGLRQPGGTTTTERKNSRSSEDIVQAVNRDPAPSFGKTRSGASTLPLNSRAPVDGKSSFRPLRSMISRFKKNKHKQSHLSLADETALMSPQEYQSQELSRETTSTLERSNRGSGRHGSTKQRRNSASSSGSKKTSLFARIFLRRK